VFKNSYIDVELYDTKLPKGVVLPCDLEEPKELEENILEIATPTIKPKEKANIEDVQIENVFEKKRAAEFGTLAHLVLELGYKIFTTSQESSFIDDFIQKYEVQDEVRLRAVVENFKNSVIFEEISKADMVAFEQEYNFFDKEKNYNQLRIIDLLYFYDGRWNIIDFKSNSLSSRTKDEIIKEHNYQEQLDGYYEYVAKIYG
jgi:ATP-dependent exoDNAse (exonuclease V) beta subunit